MANTVEQLLRLGVHSNELHMYGYRDRDATMRFSDGEYNGWSDDDDDDYFFADEPADAVRSSAFGTFDPSSNRHARMTVGVHVHGDYGPHGHAGDADHSDAPMAGGDGEDEWDDGEEEEEESPISAQPGQNNYAPWDVAQDPMWTGDQSDIVSVARNMAATRHPGYQLEELPATEQHALLAAAASAKGYMGDGNPRMVTRGATAPTSALDFDGSPPSALWQNTGEHAKMAEQREQRRILVEQRDAESIDRFARHIARVRYGKQLSELSPDQVQTVYGRVAAVKSYRGA